MKNYPIIWWPVFFPFFDSTILFPGQLNFGPSRSFIFNVDWKEVIEKVACSTIFLITLITLIIFIVLNTSKKSNSICTFFV